MGQPRPVKKTPPSRVRHHSIRIMFSDEERAQLETEAMVSGSNMADTVRRALREHLGRRA